MIRFPYKASTVRGTRGGASETIYRPMIPIVVYGPDGNYEVMAWVDTGSDDTLFPDNLIRRLGVVLNPNEHAVIAGIEGSMTVVRYGMVDLEIPEQGGGYRWSARVGFHAGPRIVLGHCGFLEFFTASFNGRNRHLTLTPNGLGSRDAG
jgi:hypothetical protein